MTNTYRITGASAGLLVLACMLACGKFKEAGDKVKAGNDLRVLGMAYHSYIDAHKKGPANADEWLAWPGLPAEAKSLIPETRAGGKFVIYWGAKIPGSFPQGTDKTALGYESKTPDSGGMVLMGDGSVQFMDAQTFKNTARPTIDQK